MGWKEEATLVGSSKHSHAYKERKKWRKKFRTYPASSSQHLCTKVNPYQCEIPVIQALWLCVVLCRAFLRLRGRLMAPHWMSWGLCCLSWTGTVWLWWTEELWPCGWRRWGVSAFLKRVWETLVPCSLRKTCSGKGNDLTWKRYKFIPVTIHWLHTYKIPSGFAYKWIYSLHIVDYWPVTVDSWFISCNKTPSTPVNLKQ